MSGIDKEKLLNCLDILIFKDENMREKNINDILSRLNQILSSQWYYNMLNDSKVNWLNLPINEVITNVLEYFNSFESIEV